MKTCETRLWGLLWVEFECKAASSSSAESARIHARDRFDQIASSTFSPTRMVFVVHSHSRRGRVLLNEQYEDRVIMTNRANWSAWLASRLAAVFIYSRGGRVAFQNLAARQFWSALHEQWSRRKDKRHWRGENEENERRFDELPAGSRVLPRARKVTQA